MSLLIVLSIKIYTKIRTKRQYSNKVKHLYDWFKEFHPQLCVPPDNVELDELNLVATTREGSEALIFLKGGFRSWSWKGRFHLVPQDFQFPAANMSNIWHLWWTGRTVDRIAPFSKLEPYDLDNKICAIDS